MADHYASVIGQLASKSAVIGHWFGGLLAQFTAGRDRAVPVGCHTA